MNKQTLTFGEIEAALARGKVQMIRPHGDWVTVRRRGNTQATSRKGRVIRVFMEAEVEAAIYSTSAALGFPDVRIVP